MLVRGLGGRLWWLCASVAGVLVLCSCTAGQSARLGLRPLRSPRPVVLHVDRRVGLSWWIPSDAAGGIAGFVDPVSVASGRPVQLFVSTRASGFVVRAFRMGWYGGAEGQQVWLSRRMPGRVQPGPIFHPATTRTVTTRWRVSTVVSTVGWRPGMYLLRLDAGPRHRSFVPLVVRARSAAGRVVIISPVTTWQAYNLWGCCDLYQGGDGGFATRSRAVSFDRPYSEEHGAGQFIRSELGILAEAQRLKLPLDYVTDVDLQQHPRLLVGARAVVSVGHDEYWSPEMRATLATAIATGANVAFFGANGIFRRIRFAPTALGPDRLEINYKVAAEDPLFGHDNRRVTANWPAPPDAMPESSLLGAQYACDVGTGRNDPGVVAAPNSWVFAGTHARRGEMLPGLIGPETDAVQPGFPTPRPIEVLLHSPASCPSDPAIGYADTTYYVARSGAGVFDAGTIAWACALVAGCADPVSRRTETVTRRVTDNVLRAFAAGPAGRLHPAVDNLAALGITSNP